MASTPRRPDKGRAAAGKPAGKRTKPAPRKGASRKPPADAAPPPPPEARPNGRPPSPEFLTKKDEILLRIAGGEELLHILREEGMPSKSTWYARLVEDQEFSDAHTRARKAWSFAKADECVLIADEVAYDTKVIIRGDSSIEVPDTEWIARTKIRIETRLKLIGQYHARQFGPKVDVTSDGEKVESGVVLMPPLDAVPIAVAVQVNRGKR